MQSFPLDSQAVAVTRFFFSLLFITLTKPVSAVTIFFLALEVKQ